ncbi:MAG: PaaI family thioesterase [Draconibacterium sp.]
MTIKEINKLCKNTLVGHLDIEFLSYGEDFAEARMLVDQKKWQPAGLLHGGASLALAETVASGGSMLLVDPAQFNVLGLQVSGNHISTISEGFVFARAEIIHRGNKTHVWDVKITSGEGKLISVARVTNMIIEKKQKRD